MKDQIMIGKIPITKEGKQVTIPAVNKSYILGSKDTKVNDGS